MPVYFQACKLASPIASGVDCFGIALTIAPAGIISGVTVAISHQYRPQLWMSWVLVMIGTGLLSTITADSSRMTFIGYEIIVGTGLGILSSTTYFPVLSPLPVSTNAKALAFFTFCRNFAQVSQASCVPPSVPSNDDIYIGMGSDHWRVRASE